VVLLTVGCCWLCDAVGCWLVRNLINSGTGCAGYILRLAHKGCTVGAQKARRGRAGGAQGARRGRAEGAQGARRGRAGGAQGARRGRAGGAQGARTGQGSALALHNFNILWYACMDGADMCRSLGMYECRYLHSCVML